MNKFRNKFPFFKINPNIIYFDNAGTTLKPKNMIESMSLCYKKYSFNPHSEVNHSLYNVISDEIKKLRKKLSVLLNSRIEEIEFVPSSTYILNFLSYFFSKDKKENIVLSLSNHSSNIFPWFNKGLEIRYLKNDKFGKINILDIVNKVDKKTKLVSISHIINSTGSVNDIKLISDKIKKINPRCLIIVDVSQSISHEKIDVGSLKIDILVFSAHKVYGPNGLGIIWLREKIRNKIKGIISGGGKSDKIFEFGTPFVSQIFAFNSSLELLEKIGLKRIRAIENKLVKYAFNKLKNIENITIYSEKNTKNIITFNLGNFHPYDVSVFLSRKNIMVRSGDFCCPNLNEFLNVKSAVRISFSFYNTIDEIDYLINCLKDLNVNNLIW